MTACKTCRTDWSNCDILSDGQCAACLRVEVERLRAALILITVVVDDLKEAAEARGEA